MITIHRGHAPEILASLPPGRVQALVTSPPYFQLRSYQTEPQIWGGAEGCDHAWGEVFTPNANTGGGVTFKQETNRGSFSSESYQGGPLPRKVPGPRGHTSEFCRACGAWRGELGLEPSVDLYVSHLVGVFAAARPALHSSAFVFVNIGDSYAGSGKGRDRSGLHSGKGGDKQATNRGSLEGSILPGCRQSTPDGVAAGNLLGVPWRFALAMQQDGWILRSALPLIKPNPMPQSMVGPRWEPCRVKVKDLTTREQSYASGSGNPTIRDHSGGLSKTPSGEYEDCPGCAKCHPNGGLVLTWGSGRPTSAHEFLFCFAATSRNFWNTEAIRTPHQPATEGRYRAGFKENARDAENAYGDGFMRNGEGPAALNPAGANARDWLLWEMEPSREAHYAAYPSWLPTWCIKAGTPAEVCSGCYAPFAPVVEVLKDWREEAEQNPQAYGPGSGNRTVRSSNGGMSTSIRRTLPSRPTCKCHLPGTPPVVLDPFCGSGTTLLAADRLGRDGIGIDLKGDYVAIAERRLKADNGLFLEYELK